MRWLAAAGLGAAAFALLTAALYFGHTTRMGAAVDLQLPWWTLREALASGASPYGDAMGMAARSARFYGDPPPWPAHPYRFAYPLYFAFFIAPVLPLPYPWAAAAWMAVLIVATAALALLLCHLLEWPATPAGRALVTVAGALFYPSLISIVLGQITPLVLLLLLGAQALAGRTVTARRRSEQVTVGASRSARRAGRWGSRGDLMADLVAGAMLACSTVKPQMVWLAAPLLLLGAVRSGRLWLPVGFGATLLALAVAPLLWVPDWPLQFLASLGRYATDEPTPSALLLVGHLLIDGRLDGRWTGPAAAVAAAAGIALTLAVAVWWWWRRPAASHFLAVTLAVTVAVTPLRAQTAQMALIVPLFWALRRLAARGGTGVAVAAGLGGALLVGGWLLVASRANPPDFLLRQLLPPLVGLALVAYPPGAVGRGQAAGFDGDDDWRGGHQHPGASAAPFAR
ncbi:MAG: glycosyltransferase 87 family protein [Chloroflexota bacterium]